MVITKNRFNPYSTFTSAEGSTLSQTLVELSVTAPTIGPIRLFQIDYQQMSKYLKE